MTGIYLADLPESATLTNTIIYGEVNGVASKLPNTLFNVAQPVTQTDVTQHQTALSITESQISDLGAYITDYTVTSNDVTTALGFTPSSFSGSYNDLSNQPVIPSNVSDLTNDTGFITDYTVTELDVTTHQSALTITESQISDLGAYLTDYTVTSSDVTTALGFTPQDSATAFDGTYSSLTGSPTLPSNVSDLTNDTGFITDYTVTESDVTAHEDAITISESQISDKSHSPFLMVNSARVYCYADLRWITESDDVRGFNAQDANENAGTGVDPVIEWEHMGMFIPAGYTINNLHIVGKSNNNEITEMEIYAIIRQPDPITRWETGMDNDAEDVVTDLFRDLWIDSPTDDTLTGALADTHRRTIALNHDVTQDSFISIYYKPSGTLTATRYFYTSYTWELQKT